MAPATHVMASRAPTAVRASNVAQASNPQRRAKAFRVRAEEEGAPASAPAEEAAEAPKAPVVKRDIPAARGILGIGGSTAAAAYVDATLPGNWGFDPLGLSDPEGAGGAIDPEWLGYAEIIHGRWAMLGVAGAVAPEILGNAGIIPKETGLLWYQAGVIPPLGSPDFYWADARTIFFTQVILMQFAELRRLQDYRNPGSMGPDGQDFAGLQKFLGGSGEAAYPGGGVFNFMKFCKTPEELASMKEKEIKHGRLAMMAFLGIGGQAVMTGVGPVQNLTDHLADPQKYNMWEGFATMNQ